MSEQAKTDDLPPPYPGPNTAAPYPAGPQAPYPTNQPPYPTNQPPYPTTVQPGPYVPPQSGFQQTATTTTVAVQPQRTVIVAGAGNCPNCRVGTLVEEFTCCGIFLAIIFFPLGLICCLLMRRQICTHCHSMY